MTAGVSSKTDAHSRSAEIVARHDIRACQPGGHHRVQTDFNRTRFGRETAVRGAVVFNADRYMLLARRLEPLPSFYHPLAFRRRPGLRLDVDTAA